MISGPKHRTDPQVVEKAEAWIGDAVLALAAREWILRMKGVTDGAMQARLTSNQGRGVAILLRSPPRRGFLR